MSFERATKTTLMDLPEKCLISIFKWIPLQNLDDIIEFSPQWDKLVQEHVPIEVHLTDIGFRVAMHYFIGYEDLPKYRIKVAHSRVLDEHLPELKSPEDLKVLEFATHTEPFTFKSLVSKATNLRDLYFSYSSLTGSILSDMDLQLPNLKVLIILDREILGKYSAQSGPSILATNISGFLKKSFPSLEVLSITTMTSRKQTIDYVQDLLLFIQNHCDTLKKVKFGSRATLKMAEDWEPVPATPIYANEYCLPSDKFDLNKLAAVKLEELDLNFGFNFFVGLEQWAHLLSSQRLLSHLNIGMEKPLNPSTFIGPIANSSASIASLQLGAEIFEENQNQRNPLDLSILAQCNKLKMLVLKGPIPTNPDLAREPSPELLNVNKLPISLTCLAIENIYVETQQVSEITKELVQNGMKLEKLSLRNIGTKGDYGVKLSMLDSWISTQLFQEVIVNGVNEEGESQMLEYKHLGKLGAKSPLKKCKFHAFYFKACKEYKKPEEQSTKY